MVVRHRANHCGVHYETSIRSPVLPNDIGMGQKGPTHGIMAQLPVDFGAGDTAYACLKCGLVQNRNGRKAKFGGVASKCTKCNRPLVAVDIEEDNLFFCIRCGRVWDASYGKNTDGESILKCMYCGGNCGQLYDV